MEDRWDALRYADYYVNKLGLSVIPVNEKKLPVIKSWKEYQTRRPTNEEIKGWFGEEQRNVAIVTGAISNLSVVDIDSEERASEISFDGAYPIVHTPRGGKHIYCSYAEGLGNSVGLRQHVDYRGEGGYVVAPPSVGINGRAYEWATKLTEFERLPLPEDYARALRDRASSFMSAEAVGAEVGEDRPVPYTTGRRDEDLFHLANSLIRGGMSPEEAYPVVLTMARSCKPPFPQAEAVRKVQSALERAGRKEVNLTEGARSFVGEAKGYFAIKDVADYLGVYDRKEKNKLYVVMSRLQEEGLVERHKDKNGIYRKVESELEEMDWLDAECNEYDVKLPFGLNELVEIYANNIIVIAGTPDSGKTAFLMNVAKLNMAGHEVHYFNSEMGVSEFRKRLLRHRDVGLKDWKIKAWSRAGDFADCIVPDAVNIIDFLEVSDAFYKVGAEINDIYRKLDGGLAFIGLQKPPGRDLGRGGTFSSEKPRLYLSVDANRIKIAKAKNWRDPSANPNGLCKDFKLFGGASFEEQSGWYKDNETFRRNFS